MRYGSKKPGIAEEAAIAWEIGTSMRSPLAEHHALGAVERDRRDEQRPRGAREVVREPLGQQRLPE